MDILTLLLSLIGGATMGSYPVPIKHRPVVEANVHPLIFQCYKSFWVFISGFLFLIPHFFKGSSFEFSWWAVLATAAWIPGGVCTIAAVPRIGMGMTSVLNSGTSSWLSFLVFWLYFDEKMEVHSLFGYSVYFAPLYLICMLVGMVLLVVLGAESTSSRKLESELQELVNFDFDLKNVSSNTSAVAGLSVKPDADRQFRFCTWKALYTSQVSSDWIFGIVMAVAAGFLGALQAGAVTIGRHREMLAVGCTTMLQCPAEVQERFNSCGSWMTSFGIGAALVTSGFMLAMKCYCWQQALHMPSLCLPVMLRPGSLAGILWCVGNFAMTAAITRGGNAVVVPACCSVAIITSGSWGLFYYNEVRGSDRISQWCHAAAFTLCSMMLLSHERS